MMARRRDFLAKFSEIGDLAQGFQPRKLAEATGPLVDAFGVGSEAIASNPSSGRVSIDFGGHRPPLQEADSAARRPYPTPSLGGEDLFVLCDKFFRSGGGFRPGIPLGGV